MYCHTSDFFLLKVGDPNVASGHAHTGPALHLANAQALFLASTKQDGSFVAETRLGSPAIPALNYLRPPLVPSLLVSRHLLESARRAQIDEKTVCERSSRTDAGPMLARAEMNCKAS